MGLSRMGDLHYIYVFRNMITGREYVGMTFEEVRARPSYIVSAEHGFDETRRDEHVRA